MLLRSLLWLLVLATGFVVAQAPRPPRFNAARVAAAEKTLDTFGCKLTRELTPLVPAVRLVTEVTFPPKTTDADFLRLLPSLQQLPALRSLDFTSTGLTDRGGIQIGKIANLTGVNLKETKIGAETLKALLTLKQLTFLGLDEIKDLRPHVKYLGEMPQLTRLQLNALLLEDDDLVCLKNHRKITQLSLGRNRITHAGLKHLRDNRALSSLSLYLPTNNNPAFTRFDDEAAKVIAEFPELHSLVLSGHQLTDRGVQHLTTCRKLCLLCLEDNPVAFRDVPDVHEWTQMGELDLSGAKLDDESLANVARIPALRRLDIGSNPIRGKGLKHLTTMPALESLQLSNTPLENGHVGYLARCPLLRSVSLSYSPVNDDDLLALAPARSLESVHALDTRITKAGAAKMRRAAPRVELTVSQAPPGFAFPKMPEVKTPVKP